MLCCERYSIIYIVVIIVVSDWFSLVDTRKKQHTRSYCLTAFFTPKKANSFLAISFEVALLKKKKKKQLLHKIVTLDVKSALGNP